VRPRAASGSARVPPRELTGTGAPVADSAPLTGARVTPLVHNPGRLMITTARLYFQPFNNVDADPVSKFNLRDITRLVRRRHLLRQIVGASAPSATA